MRIRERLKSFLLSSSWPKLVFLIVLTAITLTVIGTSIFSFYLLDYVSLDLLLIGIIEATFISLLLALVVIRLVKKISLMEEEKKNRERIEKSERAYQLLSENISDVVWVYNLNSQRLTFITPSIEKLRGYTVDEVMNQPMEEMLIPESYHVVQSFISELVPMITASGKSQTRIAKIGQTHKNGSIVWTEIAATLIKNQETDTFEVIGVTRDITDRKRAEEEAQKLGREWQTTFDAVIDGVWLVDTNQRIIRCNKSVELIFEKTSEQIRGKQCCEIIHNSSHPITDCPFTFLKASSRRESLEQLYLERWLSITIDPVFDESGKLTGAVHTLRDVTDQKKSQIAIERTEQIYRNAITEAGGVPYQTMWTHERYVFLGDGIKRLTGYSTEELTRKMFTSRLRSIRSYGEYKDIPHNERVRMSQQGLIKEWREDYLFERKDGTLIWLADHSVPVYDKNQTVVGSLGILIDISEQKQVEESLRAAEENYRHIFEKATVGIFQSTVDGKFLKVNPAMAEIYGYSSPEEMLSSIQDISRQLYVNADDRKNFIELLGQEDEISNFINENFRKDGTRIWTQKNTRAVKDESGKILYYEGFLTDITEHKHVEEALRQSEDKMKSIFRVAPVGIGVVVNRIFVEVNTYICQMTGYEREELIGKSARMIYPTQEDYDDVGTRKYSQISLKGTGMVETRWRRKDGSILDVLLSSTPIYPENLELGVTFTALDINERKRVEKALRENEYFLTKSQEVGGTGSYYFTVETGTWVSSKKLDEIFGIDEFYTKNIDGWIKLIHYEDADEMSRYLSQYVITEHHRFDKEYRIVRKSDGQERWVHGIGELEFDSKGNTVAMIGTIQDITDRKNVEEEKRKLQDQLLQAQKMEAIGRLAGGVAHDFNNMIGVILGYASMLEKNIDMPESSLKKIKAIISAAERSANLTKQLLTFARRQIITPVPLDLNKEVQSLKQMLSRLIGEDITLVVLPAHELWTVKIDPTQITQILTNLSSNARDAITDVGIVTISTTNNNLKEPILCRGDEIPAGEYVVLAFSDTGMGMEKSIIDVAFEPFFTTKPKGEGTGLGLSTVFGIVKQNHGFIDIYSEVGHGTTVKIYFPRYHGKPERTEEKTSDVQLTGSETILVVEDEEGLLNLTCSSLEIYHYHVLKAHTPSEAISHCEARKRNIDLLITDVVMPGMNGKELKDRISSLQPGIKILFMSGYSEDIVAHRGILEKGVHFLQKPFTPTSLARKVREVLNS